uniref:Microtubule-associated protein TORTIFOLIA1 n=1 Tax=Anthurium amnicola TaxID=1678845 RepID=A0A1D1XXL7_9ARAE
MSTSSLGSNTLRSLHHSQSKPPKVGGGRGMSSQQAAFELKHRVFQSLNKLGDRDTYQIGVEELEKVVDGLGPEGIAPFLSCITETVAEQKSAVRKECVRMMGTLARFHGSLVTSHLGKMTSSIVKRLKDQDSVVRDACVETVGLLASSLGGCGVGDGGGTFVVLAKPLFEALGEQSRYVQMGAALCLARVIDEASEVPISILPQMLNRIVRLLKNPHFMAKPALVDLIRSIVQAGGASTMQALSSAVNSIQEALKSSEWITRKAAAVALLGIAANAGPLLGALGPFKTSSICSLESCRFDKVKPVRDVAVQALHCWKSLPVSDSPELSEAGSSTKENFSGVDFPDTITANDGGWKETSFRKSGRSNLSGNSTNSTKRSPLAVRKTCPNYVQNRPHSRTNDWHVEISLPKNQTVPRVDAFQEESEGSCVTKSYELRNENANIRRDNKYDYDLLDDKPECSATSDHVSVSFETKHVTVTRGCLEEGDSVNLGRANHRFVTDIDHGRDVCSPWINERKSMDSIVTEINPQDLCGRCLQSANELALIRKQLLSIESRQSSLIDLLQAFTGNSMDVLSALQSKVHSLESAVDKIAQNFAPSGNCISIPSTKLLRKDHSVVSSPRLSTCSPRPSVDMNYRQSSFLSTKSREMSGETAPSRSRSSASVKEGADLWIDSTVNIIRNPVAKGNQKVSGRCPQSADTSAQQNNSEKKSAVWKQIRDFIRAGDVESAYVEAIGSGDDLVLIELMNRTGAVLERLSQDTASKILSTLSAYILDLSYVDFVIPWLQQVVNLGTPKDTGRIHLSRKARRELLSAVQEAAAMDFHDPADRASIEQLAVKLGNVCCEIPCRSLPIAPAIQVKRNMATKA